MQGGGELTTKDVNVERRRRMAAWVTQHVIPHERAVRAWLARHASQEDVDDVFQESYSRCAALASVDHIQRPAAYSLSILRHLSSQRLPLGRAPCRESVCQAV